MAVAVGDILAWLGSLCLAVCGVPQAVRCWRQGHAEGVSPGLVYLWLAGEMFYLVGTPLSVGWVWWIMFNIFACLSAIAVILRYMIFPRNRT